MVANFSIIFFVQLTVILAAARVMGWVGRRWFGQPQVVGEMIAGVLLGPSLLGWLAPTAQAMMFPPASRGLLYVLAQLGVGLYMFLVGLGFRTDDFRRHARGAVTVSLSGMASPFLVAVLMTPWLMQTPGLFGGGVTPFQATLFLGAAIAITAFPMLARMIHEAGLSATPLGGLALTAGAIDDAAAWGALAVVLASLGDGPGKAVLAIGGGLGFAAFALTVGRRALAWLGREAERRGGVDAPLLAITLILFALSAAAMDAIGVHAVFGGFVLGVAMPRGLFAKELRRALEPFTVVALLPMFFTFSGLNTRLTLLADPHLLALGAVILLASIAAKGGACYLAARLTGQDHRTAGAVGALMNARGLMELIIINIGLQRGVIGPALFAMLSLMAMITTLIAQPVFEAVYGRRARREGVLPTKA